MGTDDWQDLKDHTELKGQPSNTVGGFRAGMGFDGNRSAESSRPQIRYAAVLRSSSVVLVEHSDLEQGTWRQEVLQLSRLIDEAAAERSYFNAAHAYHFSFDICLNVHFVCMADKAMGRRLPLAFLVALRTSFQRFEVDQVANATTLGMQSSFSDEVRRLVEHYNSPDQDRTTVLTAKVRDINEDLMESIDKLMQRGEQIDQLVDRSNLLSLNSASFQRAAERYQRRQACCSLRVVIVLTVLGVSAVGAGFIWWYH